MTEPVPSSSAAFTAGFGRVALTRSRAPEVIDSSRYHRVRDHDYQHNFIKHDSAWILDNAEQRLLLDILCQAASQALHFRSYAEQCKDVFKRLADGSDPNAIGSIFRWK